MPRPQPIQITLSFTDEEAHDFLNKLANDRDFRARLRANPREVLREEGGIDIDTGEEDDLVPETIELPPVEEIRELIEQLGGPELTGEIDKQYLGRACYIALISYGFGAMPLPMYDGA